jgi:myo-inositol catabolism protein IolC
VTELKGMVVDAALQARIRITALGGRAALLIGELTGAAAGARARDEGIAIAVPIEVSGAPSFTLEYGPAFLEHLGSYPADYAKALVSINSAERDERYLAQLAAVSAACRSIQGAGHQTLLEILVPPTGGQLAQAGNSQQVFDARIRPSLVCQVINDCYAAGLDPNLWRLEGLKNTASYQMVGRTLRRHSASAECLVLGRGGAGEQVSRWLALAAAEPEFSGFAIGRSIWQNALGSWIGGKTDRARAVSLIAEQYFMFACVYRQARPSQRPEHS